MRRILGALLVLTVLSGCGSEDGTGDDTRPTPTDSSSPASFDYDAELVSETAAGGTVVDKLIPIDSDDQLRAFLMQFDSPTFRAEITEAAAVQDGAVLAAVVAIGCDIAPNVEVTPVAHGYLVSPGKVIDPLEECLAAVTTVAVVTVH